MIGLINGMELAEAFHGGGILLIYCVLMWRCKDAQSHLNRLHNFTYRRSHLKASLGSFI